MPNLTSYFVTYAIEVRPLGQLGSIVSIGPPLYKGAGRPHPHMLHDALQAAGLLAPESPVDRVLPDFDYGQVLKVGDTVQDVAEGRNVGTLTIAVTSGTQAAATLAQAGPAAVLPSVAELPNWLVQHGYVVATH